MTYWDGWERGWKKKLAVTPRVQVLGLETNEQK